MLRSVARLVFSPPRSVPPDAPDPAVAPTAAMVDLFAYAEDCILSGRIALTADRLTDVLNSHDEYTLIDVLVESLLDGHVVEQRELLVARDELLLVQIVGPRGNPEQRQRTRQHPLELQVGPYRVRGYLHALPGSDPIASLRHRRVMVPFTEVTVEHSIDGVAQRRHISALLVNRDQIDSVAVGIDAEVEMPDVPFDALKGPLLKDFTGAVLADDDADPATDG
jgi:hypothetical protein